MTVTKVGKKPARKPETITLDDMDDDDISEVTPNDDGEGEEIMLDGAPEVEVPFQSALISLEGCSNQFVIFRTMTNSNHRRQEDAAAPDSTPTRICSGNSTKEYDVFI